METKQHTPATVTQATQGAGRYGSYAPLLEEFGIPFTIRKPWLVVGQPDYDDRWVVCLSLCLRDTEAILRIILPVLNERDIPFLLIADRLQHNRINNHAYPAPLFGKALQVFPRTAGGGVDLTRRLRDLTSSFEGLLIPAAVWLGSIVYAVYATRNPDFNKDAENSLPFLFSADVPDEVGSPFPVNMVVETESPRRFLKKRYLPVSLIRSSPKGNILKALDFHQFKWVFIKQANAWASEDFQGRVMRDRLLWQQEVANTVSDWVRTPKIIDFIDQDGFSYLVAEYITATTLESIILAGTGTDNRIQKILGYYYETLLFVDNLHRLGYVHRDLTAKNILIHEDGVYLTDFELAHRLDDIATAPYVSGTIGYMSPEQKRNMQPTVQEDIYTLGALLYYIISGENPKNLDQYDKTQPSEHLHSIRAPEELRMVICECLNIAPAKRCTMDRLIGAVGKFLPAPKEQKLLKRRKSWQRIKQKLAYTGILALLAGMTVIVLWLASDEPNSRNNGFTRNYLNQNLIHFFELPIPEDVRYLAGKRGDSLYFSTLTPGQIFIIHQPTGRTKRRFLITDATLRSQLHGSNMVEANLFGLTLYDGNNRLIFVEKPDGTLHRHHVPELFTRATRISLNSIALRKFKPGERDQYLYRFDLSRGAALNESRVTEPANDGGLITSGLLDFDIEKGLGVYLTRYANRITLIDTQMRILSTGQTVDTIHNYTLQSQTIINGKGTKITNAGPAYYVNKAMSLKGDMLFVNSYVKADNETADHFRESNVLDIYRTDRMVYVGSYRLHTENKSRIRNFQIYADTLAVLTPGSLRLYKLTL